MKKFLYYDKNSDTTIKPEQKGLLRFVDVLIPHTKTINGKKYVVRYSNHFGLQYQNKFYYVGQCVLKTYLINKPHVKILDIYDGLVVGINHLLQDKYDELKEKESKKNLKKCKNKKV
ncbi:MAG: hypothetical protein IJW26_04590 [Clostridia bacterium]|nr:hypothetical protein [Clostridia bacterium]